MTIIQGMNGLRNWLWSKIQTADKFTITVTIASRDSFSVERLKDEVRREMFLLKVPPEDNGEYLLAGIKLKIVALDREGFVVVPKKPTDEMIASVVKSQGWRDETEVDASFIEDIWEAMVSACTADHS